MARVTFTHTIQRLFPCPPAEADGRTVREVLERVFAANPAARGYVLDDQGAVRPPRPAPPPGPARRGGWTRGARGAGAGVRGQSGGPGVRARRSGRRSPAYGRVRQRPADYGPHAAERPGAGG